MKLQILVVNDWLRSQLTLCVTHNCSQAANGSVRAWPLHFTYLIDAVDQRDAFRNPFPSWPPWSRDANQAA